MQDGCGVEELHQVCLAGSSPPEGLSWGRVSGDGGESYVVLAPTNYKGLWSGKLILNLRDKGGPEREQGCQGLYTKGGCRDGWSRICLSLDKE